MIINYLIEIIDFINLIILFIKKASTQQLANHQQMYQQEVYQQQLSQQQYQLPYQAPPKQQFSKKKQFYEFRNGLLNFIKVF